MRHVTVLLPVLAALAASCRPAPPPPPPAPPPAVLVPPLHDAETGETLRLRRGEEDWVWRVVSTTDTDVEVEYSVFRRGEAEGAPTRMTWPRNNFGLPAEFVLREAHRDRLEIDGRTWDCWVLRVHARAGVRWYWITEKLPVHGVLRIALDERGQPLLKTAATVVPDQELAPGADGAPGGESRR